MITAQSIKSNSREKEVHLHKNNMLEEMQTAVGGYIEMVQLPEGKVTIVDEEGLMKQKPVNTNASLVAGRTIVGDVLIMELEDLD